MSKEQLSVPSDAAGLRLDKWLSLQEALGLSRSAIQGLMASGDLLCNGKPAAKNKRLQGGELLLLTLPDPISAAAQPQELPLNIVYEDNDLLVVNKPRGMVVHPAPGHPDGTLVNALLWHCGDSLSGINGILRPGIVHRIDKDTSGLLIVAKHDQAHRGLADQIAAHSFTREYETIVCGRLRDGEGTVHAPIGRNPKDRQKMCVTQKNAKDAITHFQVLEEYARHSFVRCRLETGRTHQIRVHMAYLGHPVLGDPVYGNPFSGLEGQCLHAKTIGFVHPCTGETLSFEAPLPDDFIQAKEKVRRSV